MGTDISQRMNAENGKKPLYRSLYETIAAAIRNGRLSEGEKLPSLRSLASQLAVSRNTAQGAYSQLVSEGYIENKARSGYYVCRVEQPLPDAFFSAAPVNHSADAARFERPQALQAPQPSTSPAAAADTVIDLSSNRVDPALFPFSVLRRLYRDVIGNPSAGNLLQKGDCAGDFPLRQAIAQYLQNARGVKCGAEQVLIGAGSEYLLQLAVRLISADRFAVENPGYEKTRLVLSGCGCRVIPVPLDESGLSVSALAKSGAQAAYLTPAHQYPEGITMPVTRRTELLGWAAKTGSWIIEDDYDSAYRYGGRPVPSLQGLDSAGRVLYLGTFSRSLSPSIRVGYLVLPPVLLERYSREFAFYSCTVSRIEQAVLAEFMRRGHFERHINRTRKIYRRRRDAAISSLRASVAGAAVSGEDAGLHFTADIPLPPDLPEPAGIWLKRRAAEAGLAVQTVEPVNGGNRENSMPGIPGTKNAVRLIIGYAHLNEADLQKAAHILGSIV